MVNICRAKNPATCRYHGVPDSRIDFSENMFTTGHINQANRNHKESETFRFFLDNKEIEAVKNYCEQDYSLINKHLNRGGVETNPELEQKIRFLDSALNKYPPRKEPRILYRAGKPYNGTGVEDYIKFDTPADAEKFFATNYPVGKILHFKGFTSTTEDPNCLVDFTSPGFDSHPPAGIINAGMTREQYNKVIGKEGLSNIVYEISTSQGAPVSAFNQTHAVKEQEILLPRNMRYKIKAVHVNKLMKFVNHLPYGDKTEKRTVTVIQLEEI